MDIRPIEPVDLTEKSLVNRRTANHGNLVHTPLLRQVPAKLHRVLCIVSDVSTLGLEGDIPRHHDIFPPVEGSSGQRHPRPAPHDDGLSHRKPPEQLEIR